MHEFIDVMVICLKGRREGRRLRSSHFRRRLLYPVTLLGRRTRVRGGWCPVGSCSPVQWVGVMVFAAKRRRSDANTCRNSVGLGPMIGFALVVGCIAQIFFFVLSSHKIILIMYSLWL